MNKYLASHMASNKQVRDFSVAYKPPNAPRAYDGHVSSLDLSIVNMGKAAALVRDNPISKAMADLRAARRDLRKHQVALREIAYGLNHDNPGVIELFRVPQVNAKLEDQLASAAAMLDEARKYKAGFIDNGRPADFLEQLERSINNLKSVETTVNNLRTIRTKAFVEMEKAYEEGRRAKAYLNGIFQSVYASNPELLASLEAAMQVEYRKNPKKKVETKEEVKQVA